jgi:hypothetical protein
MYLASDDAKNWPPGIVDKINAMKGAVTRLHDGSRKGRWRHCCWQ